MDNLKSLRQTIEKDIKELRERECDCDYGGHCFRCIEINKRKAKHQLLDEVEKIIIDEDCVCGHSKKCHGIHNLDRHGANCNQCNCKIYTWNKFIFIEDLK